MSVKCFEIIDFMEKWAPSFLAESWDNPGLSVGSAKSNVKKILVALDAEEEVIDEASFLGADLIVTHHPFIFKGIKKINFDEAMGRKIYKLVKNNIGVFSAHTNLDIAFGGTNDVLAQMLKLKNIDILEETFKERVFKLAVYVPRDYANQVRKVIFEENAGEIGNYSCCTFSYEGIGTFKPLEGSNPFLGEKNKVEHASEEKIETIVLEKNLKGLIEKIIKVHPYEEPAYDVYMLDFNGKRFGIGRIGEADGVLLRDFAAALKQGLELSHLRVVGDMEKEIKKAAICTGSGIEYMHSAKKMGADVFITSDFKYHEMQQAKEMDIALIDATHYKSEHAVLPYIKKYLDKCLSEKNGGCEVLISRFNGQPFSYL